MSYSLRDLIRASGYAGVAGQSFRNHVSGAGPGAAMSQYKCNGWSFSGEPAPELTYSEGQAFTIAVDFSQGTYAEWIKRAGSGLITINPGLSPYGFDVYNQASTVVGAATGSSASFNVHAPYASGYSFDGSCWYTGYTAPTVPATTGTEQITFYGEVFADAASGTDACSVQFSYVPDIGPFNPTLTHTFPFTMNRRAASTNNADYLWEWRDADSGGGTLLYNGGPTYTVNSDPQQTTTVYLRGRRQAGDAWVNIGAVTFFDSRPAV